MPKFKKLLLIVFLFLASAVSLVFIIQPTLAASLSGQEHISSLQDSEYTLEDNNWANVLYTVYDLTHLIFGVEEEGDVEGTSTQSLLPGGGAVPQIGNTLAYMIGRPPVSTAEYLADIGSHAGLPVKSAYAQGIGWDALRPVLPIWKAFRNIAYLGFVVIFVVIGFMIMFRVKVGGQTEITLQMVLPKLIITLLLITFSYAIAGLMIDLIYIAIYLIVGVLKLGGLLTETSIPVNIILTKNPWGFVFHKESGTNFANIFIQGPGDALQEIISGLFGEWGSEGRLAQGVGGLAKLILGIALLFSLFKLFFSLLLSYLGIIISVIMAPFSLLFNALPGSNSFTTWLKGLFANIAPFPAVAAMFLLAAILIGPANNAECDTKWNPWCVQQGIGFYPQVENEKQVWVPPMLTLSNQEGGLGDANAFTGLIAFGIVMMTPQIVSQIKKMLKVEPTGFGGAIAGGLLSPLAGVGKVAQTGWGMYQNITNIQGAKAEAQVRDKLINFMQGQQGGQNHKG